MKKIFIKTNHRIVDQAIDIAEMVLSNALFHDKLALKKDNFDFSNLNGEKLSEIIQKSFLMANFQFYRPFYAFSKANAYVKKKYPKTIFLNERKLSHSSNPKILAQTIIHEYIHLLDFSVNKYFFGHGSNSRKAKENTAPYFVEDIVKEIIQ